MTQLVPKAHDSAKWPVHLFKNHNGRNFLNSVYKIRKANWWMKNYFKVMDVGLKLVNSFFMNVR